MSTDALRRLTKLGRPAEIRAAVARRMLAATLARRAHPRGLMLETLGDEYGGWTVPTGLIEPDWIVWSLGTGHDASFDIELLRRYGCRVRAFDPFARNLRDAVAQAGAASGYSTHQLAIAAHDGPIELTGDPDPDTGSVAAGVVGRRDATFTADGRAIPSLLAELGDDRIDLLKMDIEGAEYDVLETLDLGTLGVRVLCVELHVNVPLRRARTLLAHIRAQGYGLVAGDGGDATFVRMAP